MPSGSFCSEKNSKTLISALKGKQSKDLFDRSHNPSHSTLYPESRCFENKNNNYWERKQCKNAICLLLIYFTKQIHFCKYLFHNNYCFYFQNIWIRCRMWRIVGPVEQIFDIEWLSQIAFFFGFWPIVCSKIT